MCFTKMKFEERQRICVLLLIITFLLAEVLTAPLPLPHPRPKADAALDKLMDLLDPVEADKEDALTPEIRSKKRLAFYEETPADLLQFGIDGEHKRVKRIRE